jgi:protein-disulfide isomerase
MQLQKLGEQSVADPFPPSNPLFFTAASPTVDTVDSFLRTAWGFDTNRIWRVAAILKTPASGVSKVVVYVSEKTPNAKLQTTAFFVLPDGKHAVADGVVSFGATPYADLRKSLQEHATGPTRGAASKDLMLVEFTDLQCPHCKEAQGTMDQLAKDFPNAHIVYENFPLTAIHPSAFLAAAYGTCVAQQNNEAFLTYAQAVFDTQAMLTQEDTPKTLQAAVTKAGLNPAAIDACANKQETKDKVNASIKLAQDAGIESTPTLAVNGRLLPVAGVPYETIKTIIEYQARLDGVSTGSTPIAVEPTLKPRTMPSQTK